MVIELEGLASLYIVSPGLVRHFEHSAVYLFSCRKMRSPEHGWMQFDQKILNVLLGQAERQIVNVKLKTVFYPRELGKPLAGYAIYFEGVENRICILKTLIELWQRRKVGNV